MPIPARLPNRAPRLVTEPTRSSGVTSPIRENRLTEKVWCAARVTPIRPAATRGPEAPRDPSMASATTAAPVIRVSRARTGVMPRLTNRDDAAPPNREPAAAQA